MPDHLPLKQRVLLALLALLIGTGFWLGRQHTPILAAAEHWLDDLRFAYGARLQADEAKLHPDVVVIGISEKTLAAFPYRSPLDRGFLAELIDSLNAKGARAIGIDLLLDQQSEPDKWQRLIGSLKNSQAPVTLAWVTREHEQNSMLAEQRETFTALKAASGVGAGLVNIYPDESDVVRHYTRGGNGEYSGFPVAILESLGLKPDTENNRIAYRPRQADSDRSIAVYNVIPKRLKIFPPKKWLQDKIVLIGAVRPYEDRHMTPFRGVQAEAEGMLPGVLIHAHVVAQLLDQRNAPYLKQTGSLIIHLSAALLGLALALSRRPWPLRLLVVLLSAGLYGYGSYVLFEQSLMPVLLPLTGPTLTFLLVLGLATAWLGHHHRRQKQFLRKAFSHYVSPKVVDELQAQPERLQLGGERRELTFVFTDIAGFTTLSEKLSPDELSALINEYLDGMVDILFEHQGTLDKFIGDAIVAIFGAPGEQNDHAERAVACAIAMDCFAEQFAKNHQQPGKAFGITRIGINSGEAVIGNFGGTRQFNYTALGDTVNTAARLEGANKYLGTRICIAATTADQCPKQAFRPVGELVLKGKTEGIETFEPLNPEQAKSDYTQRYRTAYTALQQGETQTAKELLADLQAENAKDALVRMHLERLCEGENGVRVVLEGK